MIAFDISSLNWEKGNGLIPVIIQDEISSIILMHAYMNLESLKKTIKSGFVTFYSRSSQKLWVKGETSGNFLIPSKIIKDCDSDCLLIYARAIGNTCHTGSQSCFNINENYDFSFINEISNIIRDKFKGYQNNSYINSLFHSGIKKIAQKIGEEGVEVTIAAISEETLDLQNEIADLFFHLMILMEFKKISFKDVLIVLKNRKK
jgi:phosphoribosyl-ATP pyrophosphohydrolase/phosphoribosyl-AMP cyclohydrolase